MTALSREEIERQRSLRRAKMDLQLVQRYEPTVRYARSFGWLEVRDPFTGEWLEIRTADAPRSWQRAAFADKQRRRRLEAALYDRQEGQQ